MRVFKELEDQAVEAVKSDPNLALSEVAGLSIAISLKRIADVLETDIVASQGDATAALQHIANNFGAPRYHFDSEELPLGEPIFTDIPGAKDQLCCSRAQIYKLIDAGDLDRVKLSAKTLITVESIKRYAAKLIANGPRGS